MFTPITHSLSFTIISKQALLAEEFVNLKHNQKTYIAYIPLDIVKLICPYVRHCTIPTLEDKSIYQLKDDAFRYNTKKEFRDERSDLLNHIQQIKQSPLINQFLDVFSKIAPNPQKPTFLLLSVPTPIRYDISSNVEVLAETTEYIYFLKAIREVSISTLNLIHRSSCARDVSLQNFSASLRNKIVIFFVQNTIKQIEIDIEQARTSKTERRKVDLNHITQYNKITKALEDVNYR